MFSAYTWNKTCLTWEELFQYNSSNFVLRIAFLPFQNYSDNFCAENILRILAIEVIHDEVLILISLLNNLLFANILRKLYFLSKNRSGMNVKTFLLRNLIWKLFSFNQFTCITLKKIKPIIFIRIIRHIIFNYIIYITWLEKL